MFYEHLRDSQALYKRDACSAFEHFHKSVEVIYNLGPDRVVFVDLKQLELRHGCVLALMPYQVHYLPYDPVNDGYCAVLPSACSDSFLDVLKDLWPVSNIIPSGKGTEMIKKEMQQLADGIQDNMFIREGHINMLLGALLDNMEFTEDPQNSQSGDFIQAVVSYVDAHYAEELNIENVAHDFGYSKYYFSRLFNRYFYTNFTNYFNTVRIYKSLPMIARQRSSEVYFKVGFASVQQYITYFKRTTGFTPTQYRKIGNFKDR